MPNAIPRRSIVSHAPGRRRFQLRLAGILEAKRLRLLALATSLLLGACRAAMPAPAVETVGALSPSDTHVMQAPVHATTDLSGGFQAVDSNDAPSATPAAADVEAPDVAPKGGLVMGVAR